MPIDQGTINVHLGKRLYARRSLLGLSQRQLAEHIGRGYQQIQLYEAGRAGIFASQIPKLAAALHVPESYFFEGLGGAS